MSKTLSSILIYGICETPSTLWDVHQKCPNDKGLNRQYICLDNELFSLRIGSKGWLEVKPTELLQFQSNSDMNSFTKEMLLSKVSAFSKPIKNALLSYFTWVENECLKISEGKLSHDVDPLFTKADQLFYSAYLPLPHPKVVISDENQVFQGVANFDLSFCIGGKVYLLTFSEGQFIRKTEREFREKLFEGNNKFIFKDVSKPMQEKEFDIEFINQLINSIPSLKDFVQQAELPHGIYYPEGLTSMPK